MTSSSSSLSSSHVSASSITSSGISASSSLSTSIPSALFFKNQKPEIMERLAETPLYEVLANIVADYAVGSETCFGPKEWEKYFRVAVKTVPKLPKEFYEFWESQDPIDPTKKVSETHLPPVLRPASLTLKKLGELVQRTKKTPAQIYDYRQDEALKQIEEIEAGPACWLVMRKGILARGYLYDAQIEQIKNINDQAKAGYEEGPSAIDLATVVFTRRVQTGELYLGDEAGIGARWTFSRCKETVTEGDVTTGVAVGGSLEGRMLRITPHYGKALVTGIAVLRKF